MATQRYPKINLPYERFDGLPETAQRQIYRDLQALAQAVGTVAYFDAIIDPTLSVSDPSSHQYINLTELVAHESWLTTHTLRVGVKQQANIAISEPGSIDISAMGDLAIFGLGGPLTDGSHAAWSWGTVFCAATQQVYYYNLSIGGNSTITIQNGGLEVLDACFVDSHITSPAAVTTALIAKDTRAMGTWFLSSGTGKTHFIYDCHLVGAINVSNLVTLYLQGGTIGTQGGSTITVGGSGNAYISASILSNLTINSTAAAATVVNNTGEVGGNVSVTSTVPMVTVTGPWAAVSFTGTPAIMRKFDGSADSVDFTGPGQVIHTNKLGGANPVKLRGKGVDAVCAMALGASIQGIGLVDSQIRCTFGAAGVFSLDAACTRVVAVLSGSGQAGWGGTTDLGTNNRIITELGDMLGGVFIPANAAGFRGPMGPEGPQGDDGLDGFPGTPGVAGATGPQGAAGVGARGQAGEDGEDGYDGFPGPPGPPGATGPQGAAGVGAQGQAGVDGEDGLDGLPGPQGAVGSTGAVGASIRGQAGEDGEDGLDGLPGPQGAVGATGLPGASIRGMSGEDGEDGLDGLPGPQGAVGPIGLPGVSIRGMAGEDGEDGFDGFPGPPGAPGAPGTPGAAGASIRGQAGEDGEDGLDGFPGPQGAPGATGPQGAAGVGARGQAGEDGEDGLDGLPGQQGAVGPTGPQGVSIRGSDGQDGEDGLDGMMIGPSSQNTIFAGAVWLSPGATIPAGWLLCDGTSYLRTDYPALFAFLGGAASPWGLPDGTHFNVPDMREAFPLGKGATHALGASGGATTHSHGTSAITINSHAHGLTGVSVNTHKHTLDSLGWALIGMTPAGPLLHAAQQTITAVAETIHFTTAAQTAAATTRTEATILGGTTDNQTTAVGLTGNTDGPTAITGVTNNTDLFTGPVDPFKTFNYLIKF